jgi:hypothetical protein
VSTVAPSKFGSHFQGLEVDIIMNDDDVAWVDFEEGHDLLHGCSGSIHKCLRLLDYQLSI